MYKRHCNVVRKFSGRFLGVGKRINASKILIGNTFLTTENLEDFMKKTNKYTYELYKLFIDYTYMFRSPSTTIIRVYNIKKYNRKRCVANLLWY
jgi:hypothetical protein